MPLTTRRVTLPLRQSEIEGGDPKELYSYLKLLVKSLSEAFDDLRYTDVEIRHVEIVDYAIEGNNIANAVITSAHIENATILGEDIANATIAGSNIINATITATQIENATITGTEIANAIITSDHIVNATILGEDIHSATITGNNIVEATIQSVHIEDATIVGGDIASATIAGNNLINATITATQIENATITGGKIAEGTITSGNIADGTIVAGDIANLTIIAGNIANLTITAGKIESYTLTALQIAPNTITGIKLKIGNQSWSHDLIFSSADLNTVAWASGTITMADGSTVYSIEAGNTGDMSARTFIYLDAAVSVTVLQTTTTAGTAVGDGKILITIAEDSTTEANFQVFGGIGGIAVRGGDIENLSIEAAQIASGAIEEAKVAADAITATKLNVAAIHGTTGYLNSGTVDTAQIVNDAVTSLKVLDDAITAVKMDVAAIHGTTGYLNSGTVDTAQIVNDAVTSLKVLDDAITATKIDVAAIHGITGNLNSDTVDSAQIVNDAVTSLKVLNDAITAAKINVSGLDGASGDVAANHIVAGMIQSSAITTIKLDASAVTSAKIAANTIVAGDIFAGTITATEIASSAITTIKLDAGAVTSDKIAANTIVAGDIFAGTITATELASDSVITAKIQTGAVTSDKIAANTIVAGDIFAGTITATELGTNSVTSIKIQADAVTAAKINVVGLNGASGRIVVTDATDANEVTSGINASATTLITAGKIVISGATNLDDWRKTGDLTSIDGGKISTNTITATQIFANTITASEIGANVITAAEIEAGTITASEIAVLTIVAGNIAAATITGTQIAATTIVAANLVANTITANEILANTITASEIAAGTITAAEIFAGTITTTELNFTPLYSASGTGDIVATINASAEGIVIEADNIEIRGTVTFYSGWAAATNAESDINVLNTTNAPADAGATDDTTADAAQATADGKIVTFYQSAIPTATDAGDFWFDTDDGKMYRATAEGDNQITAGEWERTDVGLTPGLINVLNTTNAPADAGATDDTAADAAQSTADSKTDDTAADAAQATADGKIVTFYVDAIPTATDAGDLWYDTGDGKMYRATAIGDNAIGGGQWIRIDAALTPGLIDALNLTNAPAAAGADVTGDNTAADTALVSGLLASRVAGWAHGSDTTKVDGGDIYANTIIASAIYGAGFGTLTITSGKIEINVAEGFVIKDGADITLEVGGDLKFGLSDSDPSLIDFGGAYYGGGATTAARGLCWWPETAGVGYYQIGWDPVGNVEKRFDYVRLFAKTSLTLEMDDGTDLASLWLASQYLKLEHRDGGNTSRLFLDGSEIYVSTDSFRPLADAGTSLGTSARHWSAMFADYLTLGPTGPTNEGGELKLEGAGAYGDVQLDNYQGGMRVINATANANLWVQNVMSALIVTERSKEFVGSNALSLLKAIKPDMATVDGDWAEVDHESLPKGIQSLTQDEEGEEVIGRNIGAFLSLVSKATLELEARISQLEN